MFTNARDRRLDRRIATVAWLLAAGAHGLLIMVAATWPHSGPAQPATRLSQATHLVFVGIGIGELPRLSDPLAPRTLQVSASRILHRQGEPRPLSTQAPGATPNIEPSAQHLDEPAPPQPPTSAAAPYAESTQLAGEAAPSVSPAPATVRAGSFDTGRSARRVSVVPHTVSSAFDKSPAFSRITPNTTASTVMTATFDRANVRSSQSVTRIEVDANQSPIDVPLEILSKPAPSYSESARTNGIEGEIVLEVEFASNGSSRVRRIVRGLGFGLDERAVAAIEQVRFTPAQSRGIPVSIVVQVSVTFRLS